MMQVLSLGNKEFAGFRDLIYKEAGIKLSELKKALVQARLSKRIRALGLESYSDYYVYLLDNYDSEKINFINAITTNKTEFFREKKHFDYLNEIVLPAFEKTGRKFLRVWSAGCSSGEEAYSIGITLLEYFMGKPRPDIKILATDIDTQVLDAALKGIYKKEQVNIIEPDILRRYFLKGRGGFNGYYQIKDSLGGMVYFRRLNLQDDSFPMKGRFDIIFCRNVIIYFDRPTQKRLFDKIHDYLADDGHLFIGHSENITSFTDRFVLVGNTMYKKNISR